MRVRESILSVLECYDGVAPECETRRQLILPKAVWEQIERSVKVSFGGIERPDQQIAFLMEVGGAPISLIMDDGVWHVAITCMADESPITLDEAECIWWCFLKRSKNG
jgi:hypothetical protein